MKKLLAAVALVALAAAGGFFAWQLAGDTERRQGAISSIQDTQTFQNPTMPGQQTITVAPTYEIRTTSSVVPPVTVASSSAGCPSTRSLLGGGYNTSPNMGGSSVFGSHPDGVTRRLRLNNPHPSVDMNVTTYAVCGSVGGTEVRTGFVTVAPNTVAEATATCPSGKSPVGGGHNTSPNMGGASVFGSYPSGASWRVRMQNPHASVSMSLWAYAVCASVTGYEVRTANSVVTHGTVASGSASCSAGKKGLAGGHNTSPNMGGSSVFGSYGSTSGWTIRTQNPHSSVNMNLTVFAVCGTID